MTAYPLDPPLECDLIMKGGVSSGVIYPRAVCELARTYRLRSVGGASVGSVAAAAAAAAEVGRARGGFEQLERLPDDITGTTSAGGTVLFGLFQPTRATAPLFRVFVAALPDRSCRPGSAPRAPRALRALRVAAAAARGLWPAMLAGAAPGLGLLWLGAGAGASGTAHWAGILAAALLAAVGAVAGAGAGALRVLGGPVPRLGFGLCTGMPGVGGGAEALTPWLHRHLQSMSGLGVDGPPLTFADLRAAGVELQTMTTNLTRRQPVAMPWTAREYFFDPVAFRGLFPDDVVRWMEEHPPDLPHEPAARRRTQLLRHQALPLRPFPAGPQLPVLVATRMSLSFPGLMTAVPLHAVDHGAPANIRADRAGREWLAQHPEAPPEEARALPPRRFEPNWFSDGGIASNLPIHFFDSPLPTRPTFAVDLAEFPQGQRQSPDPCENSYLPTSNAAGALRRWYRLPTTGLRATVLFAASVVETARGWVDAAQLVMPGYRDRIVTVWHRPDEGGLNLRMSPATLEALGERGRCAAEKLVDRFAGDRPGEVAAAGWENHRWIRFRTATAGLEEWLHEFASHYRTRSGPATPYARLAGPGADAPVPSYPLPPRRRAVVNQRTGDLLALAREWQTPPEDAFTRGAPEPRPELRLVPPSGTDDELAVGGPGGGTTA